MATLTVAWRRYADGSSVAVTVVTLAIVVTAMVAVAEVVTGRLCMWW